MFQNHTAGLAVKTILCCGALFCSEQKQKKNNLRKMIPLDKYTRVLYFVYRFLNILALEGLSRAPRPPKGATVHGWVIDESYISRIVGSALEGLGGHGVHGEDNRKGHQPSHACWPQGVGGLFALALVGHGGFSESAVIRMAARLLRARMGSSVVDATLLSSFVVYLWVGIALTPCCCLIGKGFEYSITLYLCMIMSSHRGFYGVDVLKGYIESENETLGLASVEDWLLCRRNLQLTVSAKS